MFKSVWLCSQKYNYSSCIPIFDKLKKKIKTLFPVSQTQVNNIVMQFKQFLILNITFAYGIEKQFQIKIKYTETV